MELLAHRGAWSAREERNTPGAIAAAFANGWGVETDLRDLAGRVSISHDCPAADHRLFLDGTGGLLDMWRAAGAPGRLALNIKADGLQALVAASLAPSEAVRCFVFDASVPDAHVWLRDAIVPVFVRHSDLEPAPHLSQHYARAAGVWLDAFDSDWWDGDVVRAHLDAGLEVAIVSPELHGRPHLACWRTLVDAGVWDASGVLLCTDIPAEAAQFG